MKSIVLTILYIVLALCAMAQRPMNENQKKALEAQKAGGETLARFKSELLYKLKGKRKVSIRTWHSVSIIWEWRLHLIQYKM